MLRFFTLNLTPFDLTNAIKRYCLGRYPVVMIHAFVLVLVLFRWTPCPESCSVFALAQLAELARYVSLSTPELTT